MTQPDKLDKLIIASRDSQLALWQSRYVKELLEQTHPGLICEIITMKTQGDKILDRPLNQIGGKALFMKELEVAMTKGRADIAVHSLKDVPYELPEGFALGAFCQRENPQDAFVSNVFASIDDLPQGAIVGTSSLRRKAQLLAYRSDLDIRDLRGNVQTRLKKLDDGQYDAIILAAAGLIRLELTARIKSLIDVNISLPAVGQGIVVVEYLAQNTKIKALLNAIDNEDARVCALAERSFNEALQGGCHVPIAAFCEKDLAGLQLTAMVGSSDGKQLMRETLDGDDAVDLGKALAQKMIGKGAKAILQQ
ncbi:hydroxymethylbilane synthase [Cysteiniphilum sp. QT6929]|uniref:hydroxymethylbilane synthase n=1 Tax=Cysteiniphilum sp. QT6929 TaxID=2975055 RepID=UPI0024B3B8B2|nr:hydroxymethylbilane synthase [Cysteiniphilum sp. QT6929]WHN64923.1 hydroxymethylbilane synthase [Cysteiniphilum sp. QT6929]